MKNTVKPTTTGVTQVDKDAGYGMYQDSLPATDPMSNKYRAPMNGTSGIQSGPAASYANNPEMFDTQSTSNWWDSDTYGNQTETLKKGLYQDGSKMNQNDLFQQQYGDSLVSETALRDAQIEELQGFDYMGAGSLAMQGIGTAMQMGLYGDRKDYMENVNAGLEQNLQNAEESHNTRQANTASYGSAFSNA